MKEPKHKYKLGSEVKVKGDTLAIFQVSCGEGRKEPHYWARLVSEEDKKGAKEYEFDESEVERA